MKCPTTTVDIGGASHSVIGCGSHNVEGPDHEGLMDCLNCGMFFRPELGDV